jgi:hypothetical protein
MEEEMSKYKIGYIDEESQWVDKVKLYLKGSFDIVDFILTADTTITGIITQIEEADLDCLIVDFELKEADIVQFNGDEIVDNLRKKYPYFPVFIITAKEEDDVLNQVDDNDIVRVKDELTDSKRLPILIIRIENKITSYYRHIMDAKTSIESLIEKRNNGGLSLSEEEMLTEKYVFLDKISPNEKILPDNLIQPQSISKLSEFAANTKMILEELKRIES